MKDDEEPGPSSAMLQPPATHKSSKKTSTAATTHTAGARGGAEAQPSTESTPTSQIPKYTKSRNPSSKTGKKDKTIVTVTEMKEVTPSPKGSPNTTPSSSSFAVDDSKRVVYSIFPPIHDTVMFGLTKRQLLTLVTLALTEFFCGNVYSIQAPFFPAEALAKLPTPYVYGQIGCVFGIYELAVFAFIPLFGKMMQRNGMSPKLIFHLGVFISAVSTILFAFLEYVPNPHAYLVSALVVRLAQGVGEAAIQISACALLTIAFPNSVATSFTSMETFYCLGLITGPVLEGALMDVYFPDEPGRFFLTFIVLGCLLLLMAIADLFLLPSDDNPDSLHELDGKCCFNNGGYKVFNLLGAKSIPLVALTILSAGVGMGFLNPVLELHIQEFLVGRSFVLLGGFFIIAAGLCGILAPGFNWVINKIGRSQRYFVVFGAVEISCGFMLIGPAPFLNMEKSLLMTGIGLSLVGSGLGSITVGSFKLLLNEAIHNGYANNINTYGLVLTFWTMTFCLGASIGSTASGFLYEITGFSDAVWGIIGMYLIVIVLNSFSIIFNWRERMIKKRDSVFHEPQEDDPLLSDPYYKSRKLRSYS